MVSKSILHVGAGGASLPQWLKYDVETTLDIDASTNPDIVADMLAIPEGVGPFDCVYAAHVLEHVYAHEVPKALDGFKRVLRSGGVALIWVPDLEGLSPTPEVLYESACGPVTARDLFYGANVYLKQGMVFMAHKTGFVEATLRLALECTGFINIKVHRVNQGPIPHALFAVGEKP